MELVYEEEVERRHNFAMKMSMKINSFPSQDKEDLNKFLTCRGGKSCVSSCGGPSPLQWLHFRQMCPHICETWALPLPGRGLMSLPLFTWAQEQRDSMRSWCKAAAFLEALGWACGNRSSLATCNWFKVQSWIAHAEKPVSKVWWWWLSLHADLVDHLVFTSQSDCFLSYLCLLSEQFWWKIWGGHLTFFL